MYLNKFTDSLWAPCKAPNSNKKRVRGALQGAPQAFFFLYFIVLAAARAIHGNNRSLSQTPLALRKAESPAP